MLLKEFSPRLYQETVLATCVKQNTLVVLPTGLGKTGIAMMLIAHRLTNYPNSKILMLAPTKPLVEQHLQTFKHHLPLEEEDFVLFTGTVAPAKRAKLWKTAKIICSTPQGLENDIVSRSINIKDVSLLILDEAHRASKGYAYTFIAKEYHRRANHERILALTASPGDSIESIRDVCKNVFAEQVEVRSSEDPDVKPYVQELEIRMIKVTLPPEYEKIRSFLRNCFLSKLRQIKELGILTRAPNTMTKLQVLDLSRQLFARMARGEKSPEMMRSVSLGAEALKIEHATELIETQGVYSLYEYLLSLQEQSRTSKTKATQNLVQDLHFKSALILTEALIKQEVVDPKTNALEQLLKQKLTKNMKVIIFTQFRDQAKKVAQMLDDNSISNKIFVGQAKKKSLGMSQKEQQQVLRAFREGEFSCLVATSVAEEGLDIPEVDLVVFYEPIPSAIRTVQRRGRTGRHAKGAVYVLVTKGTRDEAYHWATKNKERRMYRALEDLKKALATPSQEKPLESFAETKQNIIVHVDQRERGSGIVRELSSLDVKIELKQLDIGDYVLSDRVVIELKKVRDFVDSLVDGRLLDQARDLKRYPRPIIILEGEEDLYSQRRVHPNAIRGAIASLIVDFGITIYRSKSPQDTAGLIAIIAKREQIGKERDAKLHASKGMTLATQQEYIIASLPGIGAKLAAPLLAHFGTIKTLVNASEEELKKVALIGSAKAKRLREVFDAIYNQ